MYKNYASKVTACRHVLTENLHTCKCVANTCLTLLYYLCAYYVHRISWEYISVTYPVLTNSYVSTTSNVQIL